MLGTKNNILKLLGLLNKQSIIAYIEQNKPVLTVIWTYSIEEAEKLAHSRIFKAHTLHIADISGTLSKYEETGAGVIRKCTSFHEVLHHLCRLLKLQAQENSFEKLSWFNRLHLKSKFTYKSGNSPSFIIPNSYSFLYYVKQKQWCFEDVSLIQLKWIVHCKKLPWF